MKQEIKFVYTVEHTNDGINIGVPHKVEITLDGQAGLEELTEQFNAFVKAVGYNPPDNCVLDWVDTITGNTGTQTEQWDNKDENIQTLMDEADEKNEVQKLLANKNKKRKSKQ
jgi:hypothetical protein